MKIVKTLTFFSVSLIFINCTLLYSFNDYSGEKTEKDAGLDSSDENSFWGVP